MTSNREDPAALLVDNLLTDAQNALNVNDLDRAQDLLGEALNVKGNHPDRAATIRETLKGYSDRVTQVTEEQKNPPDWDSAHRAIEMLDKLEEDQKKLQNNGTRAWQRELWLKQADFLLKKEDLDHSFKIFSDLLTGNQQGPNQDELKGEISRIVRENISRQAQKGDLPLLNRIIQGVQDLRLPGDELRAWLETITEALSAVRKAAEQTKEEHEEQLKQQLNQEFHLKQEAQRKQSIIYALIGIFVVAAISYIVFIFVLWPSG